MLFTFPDLAGTVSNLSHTCKLCTGAEYQRCHSNCDLAVDKGDIVGATESDR